MKTAVHHQGRIITKQVSFRTLDRCLKRPGTRCLPTEPTKLPEGDPAARQSYWLRHAAANGDLNVVQALLDDGRSDPNALNGSALRLAARFGHAAVVRRLLRDGRTDPCLAASEALRSACEYGHADIVDALIQDGRSDPTADHSSALIRAAQNGHVHILRRLLAGTISAPGRRRRSLSTMIRSQTNAALKEALGQDCYGVVRILVDHADNLDLIRVARRRLGQYRARVVRIIALARRAAEFDRLPLALQAHITEMAFGDVFGGFQALKILLNELEAVSGKEGREPQLTGRLAEQ